MPNPDDELADLERSFHLALESRNFEINQLSQRNNFFMIFQGVLLAGLTQSNNEYPLLTFIVCATGLLISICQVKMAAGAKFWQERWEMSLEGIEKKLAKKKITSGTSTIASTVFSSDIEKLKGSVKKRLKDSGTGMIISYLIQKKYSVSKLPIWVGIFFTVIWGLLLLSTIKGPFPIPEFIIGFRK